MYAAPSAETPLLFGDVLSSDWLFAAVVNNDAVRLGEVNMRGGMRGYQPLRPDGPNSDKDFILAHGEACRAVLLADDCEIETCLVRNGGRGRLLFAALSAWPTDAPGAEKAATMTTFRRHPLAPADAFDGGIVELNRLFAVNGRALLDRRGRLVALEEAARAALEQRWAAFATRRGPLAALDNARKLAHLLDAGGDPDRFDVLLDPKVSPSDAAQDTSKAVARAFTQAWKVEGEVMQGIADAHEQKVAGRDEIVALEHELRTLAEMASTAAAELQSQLAA